MESAISNRFFIILGPPLKWGKLGNSGSVRNGTVGKEGARRWGSKMLDFRCKNPLLKFRFYLFCFCFLVLAKVRDANVTAPALYSKK